MRKSDTTKETSAIPAISPVAKPNEKAAPIVERFCLLKAGTAKKIGQHAEGGIRYQILADIDRQTLSITITGNDSGGYFSREIVPFQNVEASLTKRDQHKPFPSKFLKDAFVGRSSNNAGFLAAILRAEGLLAAAPDSDTQHVVSGDWMNWKKSVLAEPGQTIEIEATKGVDKGVESNPAAEHTEHTETRKTLTVKRPKADSKTEVSPQQEA